MEVLPHCGEFLIKKKQILSAKFYPSATLPTLDKVFLVNLIFTIDHMYDHIYVVYTTHKSILSVIHAMTILCTTMYGHCITVVNCLLLNPCLLFITECAYLRTVLQCCVQLAVCQHTVVSVLIIILSAETVCVHRCLTPLHCL